MRVSLEQVVAVKTLALSILVAVATLIAMAIASLEFFTSGGGLIFPAIVAWARLTVCPGARRIRPEKAHVRIVDKTLQDGVDQSIGVAPSSWGSDILRRIDNLSASGHAASWSQPSL